MKLTLATAAFVALTGAAFAQTTTTPSTAAPGTTTPGTMAPHGAMTNGAAGTMSNGTAGAMTNGTTGATGTTGVQTPAATVNQTPETTSSPKPSAVQTNNTNSRTAAAPVPGRNSFTKGEARRRITAAGFTHVMNLKKDSQGIWRGEAKKNDDSVAVALDYQGNVVGK